MFFIIYKKKIDFIVKFLLEFSKAAFIVFNYLSVQLMIELMMYKTTNFILSYTEICLLCPLFLLYMEALKWISQLLTS